MTTYEQTPGASPVTAGRGAARAGIAWLGLARLGGADHGMARLGPGGARQGLAIPLHDWKGSPMSANLISSAPQTHVALDLRITGAAPLLMHAPTLLDPIHPMTVELRKLTDKPQKKRTPADWARMAELEWNAALYHDEDLGPFISTVNVKRAFRAAGGMQRKGAAIARGVTFADTKLPLIYDGPRDREGLYAAGFRDTRGVRNGGTGGSVMRTRPCFEEWALEARVYLNPHEIGVEDFARFVADAQRYGLGDYRPEFGLFVAEMYEAEDE